MKYHKQESLYVKDVSRGSCYPTVIACLMDLELNEVPNFHIFYFTDQERQNLFTYYKNWDDVNYDEILWYRMLIIFLASRGFMIKQLSRFELPKGVPYMVTGKSKRDVNHIVIYQDGKMIHDPHPSNDGVIESDNLIYEILVSII